MEKVLYKEKIWQDYTQALRIMLYMRRDDFFIEDEKY